MVETFGGVAPSWKRVCIFVDGENFRHSLASLFKGTPQIYKKEDYLPEANWLGFYKSLINDRPGWELVRVYWYVIREIDYWPYNIPYDLEKKKSFLVGTGIVEELRAQGVAADDSNDGLMAVEKELKNRQEAFQRRADGWRKVHASIESQHDQVQFQHFGSIRYNLVDGSLGSEKVVDTQLATDMIMLSDIYDVAVVISGDADYIPPVSAVKSLGKLVYGVSFLTNNGRKLHGGARRLEQCVDGQIEVPVERLEELLGFGGRAVQPVQGAAI